MDREIKRRDKNWGTHTAVARAHVGELHANGGARLGQSKHGVIWP